MFECWREFALKRKRIHAELKERQWFVRDIVRRRIDALYEHTRACGLSPWTQRSLRDRENTIDVAGTVEGRLYYLHVSNKGVSLNFWKLLGILTSLRRIRNSGTSARARASRM